MLESRFQSKLIKELRLLFPGCIILKNDESYIQGIPDLTILYKNRWAMLECKESVRATRQPNQKYYIDMADEMSFAAFIYPENCEEILYEMEQALAPRRRSRRNVSK